MRRRRPRAPRRPRLSSGPLRPRLSSAPPRPRLRGAPRRLRLDYAARRPRLDDAPRHLRLDDAVRRAIDVVVSAIGTALTAPAVAVLAAAIRLESPGSAIYRQTRVGRDGELFSIYKLRTMVSGAEFMGAGLAINHGDERITRIGSFLRRYSLDELPNLWNVLRGEMSVVGPRPTVQVQVDQYTDRQRGRLAVKPGITGWAQINGRASLPWSERIDLDLWYVEHRTVRLDLAIMARTVRMVLGGHGLYKGDTGGWQGT
jgi:lipopolysaccharide/colanic/teichoic acid biosynthesis glycosyltransferase